MGTSHHGPHPVAVLPRAVATVCSSAGARRKNNRRSMASLLRLARARTGVEPNSEYIFNYNVLRNVVRRVRVAEYVVIIRLVIY